MKELPKVAIILDTAKAYGQGLMAGVVKSLDDFHSFVPIFVQPLQNHDDPLPKDLSDLDGAIVWSSPMCEWVHRFVAAGKVVVNCGPDWLENPKVICMIGEKGDDSHVAAAKHFFDLGIERAYAAIYEANFRPAIIERAEAFTEGIKGYSMEGGYFEAGFGDPGGMGIADLDKYEELRHWLETLETPCGIWCEDDELAILCCRLVRSLNLGIPRDVAVIGTSDSLEGRFSNIPISSIPKMSDLIGFQAAQVMAAHLQGDTSRDGSFKRPLLQVTGRESTVGIHGEVEIEHVYRYIQLHACEGITVQELVPLAGVSKKTLIKRFSDAFGVDPSVEIRTVRINKAKDLLAHTDMSIADVGSACGFSSHSSFVNFFSRMLNLSPTAWRNGNE